jgi:hypothetical protein
LQSVRYAELRTDVLGKAWDIVFVRQTKKREDIFVSNDKSYTVRNFVRWSVPFSSSEPFDEKGYVFWRFSGKRDLRC